MLLSFVHSSYNGVDSNPVGSHKRVKKSILFSLCKIGLYVKSSAKNLFFPHKHSTIFECAKQSFILCLDNGIEIG
jgi:hypothetical protein